MKRLRQLLKPLLILCLGLVMLTSWACSFDPFIINEAKRPEGWPKLTPVGEIQVKAYPTYRAAQIDAGQETAASDSGLFRPLFNHIKRNDIAMTAPVEMTYQGDEPVSMAFVYRTTSQGTAGPDNADPRVKVQDVPGQQAASLGVRGRYTAERYATAVDKLNAWLEENKSQWKPIGQPRLLGYNSPFVPWFMRYSEVQVPVEPVNEQPSPQ